MPNTKPFTTDGCSGFMSFAWIILTGHCPVWEDACIEHDKAYYAGGGLSLRRAADRKLRNAVAASGHPLQAWVMYVAVRIGGVPFIDYPSMRKVAGKWRLELGGVRWGYKWRAVQWFGGLQFRLFQYQED